jgi:RHS repeat-associated protein
LTSSSNDDEFALLQAVDARDPAAFETRLQQIRNQTSAGSLLSQFDYTYDDAGQVKTWTKNNPGLSAPQRYDLTYDNADQMTKAPLKNALTNTLITNYQYGYDLAANRTVEKIGGATTNSTPNSVNEIWLQSGGTNRTLLYDANGSLTDDGLTRTFEWDGANRLVAINTGTTNRSEFTYDGLSRCVKIVEKTNGSVTSTRKFVWCGMEKCEFRDAGDVVTDLIYPQGQYSGTIKYFYFRDHLGSIREMMRSNGTVVARFDYDPWGRSTTVINTTLPDFNYTGLYRHSASNLDMAVYRAYDPDFGRWLSRDPIGEQGGVNLYQYVANDPINRWDLFGLIDFDLFAPGTPEHRNIQLFYDDPRIYDIGAHGSPNRLYTAPDLEPYTAQDLYAAVKDDPNFRKSKVVKIWACNAGFGNNSFAKQFANLSGKTTIAGTGYLNFADRPNSTGHFSRFKRNPFNLFRPSTWSPGTWKVFTP